MLCPNTLVAPFYKHYSQRSYRLLATLAGYGCLAHSHYNRTLLAARAFRSERQLLDAAKTDRGCDIAMAYLGIENFCHRPRHHNRATSV